MSAAAEKLVSYLLGELAPDERAALEAELAGDPELAQELERKRAAVEQLRALPEEAWEPAQPPPLALPVSDIPAGRPAPQPRRRPRLLPSLAAGLAVAAVAAAVLVVFADGGGDVVSEGGEQITLGPVSRQDEGAAGTLSVASGDRDTATLTVDGLQPNETDFYEVWLLGDDGLVSLGSFRVEGSGATEVPLQLPVDPAGYDVYDVSLEPDDGDPEHSGESILRGPTRS